MATLSWKNKMIWNAKFNIYNHLKVGCNFSYFTMSRIDSILLDLVKTLFWGFFFFQFLFPKNIGKSVIFYLDYAHFKDTCVFDVQKLLFRKSKLAIVAFVHNNEAMNKHNFFVFGILMSSCQTSLYPLSHHCSVESFYLSCSAHKLSLKCNLEHVYLEDHFLKSEKTFFEFPPQK